MTCIPMLVLAAALPSVIASTPATSPAPAAVGAAASEEVRRSTAEILELEDHRSAGGGSLSGYLDPNRPLVVRVRAALAIGRIGAPVTTPYDLLGALSDKEPELRRMAVFALGEMDDIKAAPLLAATLSDADAATRALAAEALGKLKDPASLPALTRLLGDPDRGVVGMTLLALWKIDSGAALPDLVARAAGIYSAAEGELRRQAAYFLMRSQMGRPEEPSIEKPLLHVSRDEDPLVRSYAARGLGASKSGPSTEALLHLAADADWRVRANAFNGLKTRPVPETVSSKPVWGIYEAGLSDAGSSVALSALAALETCQAVEARRRLLDALKDARPRFREVALSALAARDKGAALPSLAPLAMDARWSVRARLAEALGVIGAEPEGSGAVPDLVRLAADSDARVRSVAVDALGKVPGAAADDAVASAAKDSDLFVRAAALEALSMRAPADGALIDALSTGYQRGLTDIANDARLAALAGLAKNRTDAARAAIEKTLTDPDYLVRRRAAEILRDQFKLDRFSKVGEPLVTRTKADYIDAVRRAERNVTATIKTDAGEIVVELFPADAPLTVDNFIRLARDGKFDGLAFHRVVPNFVIQDGDPRGDGNGGPPWQIRCEINLRRYTEGAVGMALSGKDTGGSQYFITHSPQPHLDGGYTVFGQVLSGQEAVNRMLQGDGVKSVVIRESDAAQPR
ncbi:MAG TPA: HEAT repeat domain-containing protein [Candidatus Polarisedimenticolia bacterium]|nr:HEAT repeat domain-containing protein [Candidatus Polarisedimenticolia bacterium]